MRENVEFNLYSPHEFNIYSNTRKVNAKSVWNIHGQT